MEDVNNCVLLRGHTLIMSLCPITVHVKHISHYSKIILAQVNNILILMYRLFFIYLYKNNFKTDYYNNIN